MMNMIHAPIARRPVDSSRSGLKLSLISKMETRIESPINMGRLILFEIVLNQTEGFTALLIFFLVPAIEAKKGLQSLKSFPEETERYSMEPMQCGVFSQDRVNQDERRPSRQFSSNALRISSLNSLTLVMGSKTCIPLSSNVAKLGNSPLRIFG